MIVLAMISATGLVKTMRFFDPVILKSLMRYHNALKGIEKEAFSINEAWVSFVSK